MWGDNDNFHRDRCSQEIDHLLVAQSGHRHLADLHQPAALPQPCLPGIAVGLHICHDALVVDVEAKLSQPIPSQSHLHRFTAFWHELDKETKDTQFNECNRVFSGTHGKQGYFWIP